MAAQSSRWQETLAGVPSARLGFVDASGARTKMTRLDGRSQTGQRLVARVPRGHDPTSTLMAGIRWRGPRSLR